MMLLKLKLWPCFCLSGCSESHGLSSCVWVLWRIPAALVVPHLHRESVPLGLESCLLGRPTRHAALLHFANWKIICHAVYADLPCRNWSLICLDWLHGSSHDLAPQWKSVAMLCPPTEPCQTIGNSRIPGLQLSPVSAVCAGGEGPFGAMRNGKDQLASVVHSQGRGSAPGYLLDCHFDAGRDQLLVAAGTDEGNAATYPLAVEDQQCLLQPPIYSMHSGHSAVIIAKQCMLCVITIIDTQRTRRLS